MFSIGSDVLIFALLEIVIFIEEMFSFWEPV
jgi:hypothetical protein